MAKILGYVLSALGIAGIAVYSIPDFYTYAQNFVRTSTGNSAFTFNPTGVLIVSVVLVLGGLFLSFKAGGSGRTRNAEVPIYHGKDVVGYRRH